MIPYSNTTATLSETIGLYDRCKDVVVKQKQKQDLLSRKTAGRIQLQRPTRGIRQYNILVRGGTRTIQAFLSPAKPSC